MSWNYCEAIDRIGLSDAGSRPALHSDFETVSYADLRRRGRGIGAWLQSLGLPRRSHVGHYMRNSNAYMETFFGAGLAGFTHVNINYRYEEEELLQLCEALDIRVLMYDAEFADKVADIREKLREVVGFVEVTREQPQNDFARALESLYTHPDDSLEPDTADDNLIIIATGGTTGLPKGTMWRHTDVWNKMRVWSQGVMAQAALAESPATLDDFLQILLSLEPIGPVFTLCPLMHGTGLLTALNSLALGTALVTTSKRQFEPDYCLDLIEHYKASRLVIVGDAFASPLLDALDRRGSAAFASVGSLVSSGAILSDINRSRLEAARPGIVLFDTLGSSEAIGYGVATEEAGVFTPFSTTRVFDDELNEVEPGSDRIGIAYSGGYCPIGYYNEPEKSAETFVTIDDQRYVKTGDRCRRREDGKLELLGRDSTVINSGGEKIYTVEVERVLLKHPDIGDTIVLGMPHPRFGKMVVAVLSGDTLIEDDDLEQSLQEFLKGKLAGYKIPRHFLVADSVARHANGKPDYPALEALAGARLQESSPAAAPQIEGSE